LRTAATTDSPSLATIRDHLLTLGARCIRSDESLNLRVLDIDLAGDFESRGRVDRGDMRVLRDGDWPKIELEYEWRTSGSRVLGQDKELVSDPNYLRRGADEQARYESLFYEKRMLTEWFERRFCRDGDKAAPG
jgi:hypothetical protein